MSLWTLTLLLGSPAGDLSGLFIDVPAGWEKEFIADTGHWVVRSPYEGFNNTPVLIVPNRPGDPTTPKQTAARLRKPSGYLDDGLIWVGEIRTEKLPDGFVLFGMIKSADCARGV